MSDIIIYNKQGKVLRCVTASPDMLEGQINANEYFIEGRADGLTQYIDVDTLSIVSIPNRPNNYSEFNWETKLWEETVGWLDRAKKDNINAINSLASKKILPKYPIYLQLNLPYDFGQDSPEVQEMRTWIDNIRTLANTAKAEIASATTLPEITTIVDNFKTELGNIA